MLCSIYSLEILYKNIASNSRFSFLCVPCERSEKGMDFIMSDNNFNKKEKKFDFSQRKDCTIRSIKEIEFFLCNLDKALKSFKIYKFLK